MKYSTTFVALTVALTSTAYASSVEPNFFQISVSDVTVEQELTPLLSGDQVDSPNFSFEDENTGELVYPNFNSFFASDNDFADVLFDQSLLPTTPPQFGPVISTAKLSGTWTFDASVLAQDLTAYNSSDGTSLGTVGVVSGFEAAVGGEVVQSGVTTSTEVIVGNNLVIGEGGEVADIISIAAGRTPGFDGDSSEPGSSGIQLVLFGGSNWFEDAAGGIPDFNAVVFAEIDLEEFYYGEGNFPQFEEQILGEVASIQVRDPLGNPVGLTEDNPVLPSEVLSTFTDENGQDLPNPVFGFDLAEAQRVVLPGAPEGIVFIDPEIAVGYTYKLEGDGEITGILAPTLAAVNDPNGYTVTINGITFDIEPGEYVSFAAAFADAGVDAVAVTELVLGGIDIGLMLDPTDDMAFVAGLSLFGDNDNTFITQQAIIEEVDDLSAVPLPAGLPLMLAGIGAFAWVRKRQRSQAL